MAESWLRDTEFDQFPVGPGTEVTPTPQWTPPKGVGYSLWGDQLPPEYSAELINWRPRNGRLEARPSLTLIGNEAPSGLVYATEYVSAAGIQYTFRWVINKLQIWSGSSWADVTGVVLTGGLADLITVTAFGGYMLFSNGVAADGTWAVNAAAGSGAKLAGVPAFKRLTTFTGRVVGSAPPGQPTRIQWSVKNDHTDWAGTGSGFEDLLSTPGGRIDQQYGVHPVTDNIAFAVRSDSVWTMTETGDFDAPFTFARRYPTVGSVSRFGVTDIPNGVAFLSRDGMFEITLGAEPKNIGLLVNDRILGDVGNFDACYMVQSPRRTEIILMVPSTGLATKLYIYNRLQETWASATYQFPSKSLSAGRVTSALSYDQLSGMYDDQSGTYDELGVTSGRLGMLFAMGGDGRHIVAESFSDMTYTDYSYSGIPLEFFLEAQTALIKAPDNLSWTGVTYVQMTYDSAIDQRVVVDFSDDEGTTWNTYVSEILPATNKPKTWTFRKYIERERLMFRVTARKRISIYGFIPYVKAGRKIGL